MDCVVYSYRRYYTKNFVVSVKDEEEGVEKDTMNKIDKYGPAKPCHFIVLE